MIRGPREVRRIDACFFRFARRTQSVVSAEYGLCLLTQPFGGPWTSASEVQVQRGARLPVWINSLSREGAPLFTEWGTQPKIHIAKPVPVLRNMRRRSTKNTPSPAEFLAVLRHGNGVGNRSHPGAGSFFASIDAAFRVRSTAKKVPVPFGQALRGSPP